MTAINNLRGMVKGVEGKVIYRETLSDNLLFVVVKRYLPSRSDSHFSSTKFEIDCGIVKNQLQDTGSVHYFLPSREPKPIEHQLKEIKTKDGFIAKEYDQGVCQTDNEGKAIMKVTEFFIEVPESFLVKLF